LSKQNDCPYLEKKQKTLQKTIDKVKVHAALIWTEEFAGHQKKVIELADKVEET
jgi:hypothetical protein